MRIVIALLLAAVGASLVLFARQLFQSVDGFERLFGLVICGYAALLCQASLSTFVRSANPRLSGRIRLLRWAIALAVCTLPVVAWH